ncbi:hypothetical protein OIY81_2185 [Cryptosporidium canis]|nr:hypothetical protein OIY81_2185 [Cryptosporidium canis]
MSAVSGILHSGIYELLVEYLDYEDVYELALVSVEWGKYLGGSFVRYWRRASTSLFGLRFDLARMLCSGVAGSHEELARVGRSARITSWFAYFEFLSTSELGKFLIRQKRMSEILQGLLYNLKVELNSANSRFVLQNSASLCDDVTFIKSIQEYGKKVASSDIPVLSGIHPKLHACESAREGGAGQEDFSPVKERQQLSDYARFSRIELDLGGLGKEYMWSMEVASITSQHVILKSELMIEDIPRWEAARLIVEYIAVWGLVNERDHILLYHHKNPFHGTENAARENGNCQTLSSSSIADLRGINYFLSSLSSFAGVEMSINEALSKITVYITIQVVVILESLQDYLASSSDGSLLYDKQLKSIQNPRVCDGTHQDLEEDDYIFAGEHTRDKNQDHDIMNYEHDFDNVSTQESLLLSEDEMDTLDSLACPSLPHCDRLELRPPKEWYHCLPPSSYPSFGHKSKSESLAFANNGCSGSYYNIELQLMDTRASIPLYLYGDLEPTSRVSSRGFADLRVHFGRSYPNSSLIKTNCLYQAGVSVIEKATGETVFSLVFPKSKSYYDKRAFSRSKRLLKLCSYSRVYGTQVPIIDPPSRLTNTPESVFTKLELLIHPHKNTIGQISELNVSLNLQECLSLFPVKKFKRFLTLQGFHSHDLHKRRINSPIKNIQKYQ